MVDHTDDSNERLYTRTEAAAIAGMSERTLLRLNAAGKGPPSRRLSPKIIRYPATALRRWLEETRA
jgi:predicted DNA-binding transcriptional regulator AlpA